MPARGTESSLAKRQQIPDPPFGVAAAFGSYPQPARELLLSFRKDIFEAARDLPGVGPITETLKWGEPAYLTETSKSGTTIRLGWSAKRPGTVGLFVSCQTSLIESWRAQYAGILEFTGNREVRFTIGQPPPAAAVRHCIAMALTYHQRKRAQ